MAGRALIVGVLACVCVLVAACSASSRTTTTTAKASATTSTGSTTAADSSSTTSSTVLAETWKTVTYEQGNPGFIYSRGWIFSTAPEASNGVFAYVDKAGATVTFHFVGTYCGWLAKTANIYGKATVTVDDGQATTVDLYSKNAMWRHLVWQTKDLPLGDHTVKITCAGKKRTGGKGICINVDAFQITGAVFGRYQQSDSRFEYSGKWPTAKDARASGGTLKVTKAAHASVTVTFTGIQLDWVAKKGPAYGKARVIVDGKGSAVVDLYSAQESWRQTVWSSGRLDMGTHVVSIRWTGAKNSDSTGTYVDVDAFQIAGMVK